ncbi:MAG: L,D-transpeptidase family protein [Rhodobacteraceae bacterium]|nr:L,D-transpeptidase family protein [Paracoccaceae bacterium]
MSPADLVLTPMGLRFAGRHFPCTVGRGGVVPATRKREGDGGTPTGAHRIVGMLYRPDRMARPTNWAVPIGPGDLWSDDVRDPDYNLMVRKPHGFGHEALRRADPLYDLVLITDWNWPQAVPGRGSAIFIHRWRRPGYPTAGCVALAPDDLLWIARRLQPGVRLMIAENLPKALRFR